MSIVGIITIPYDISKSYISYEHIKWLESNGLKTYPIPYNTTDPSYYFDRIDGLYIPSGVISKKSTDKTEKVSNKDREILLDTCSKFIKLAINENDKGNIFPIWGTCYGMQILMKVIDNDINLINVESYPDYKLPFIPTKEGMLNSKIIKTMTEDELKEWMNTAIEIHNHGKGISPRMFSNSKKLMDFFNIISVGMGKNGKVFVSLIEGKKYPFYGVQWHPEMSKKTQIILNSFVKDIKKSKRRLKKDRKEMTSYMHNRGCSDYSDGLYYKCLIFQL